MTRRAARIRRYWPLFAMMVPGLLYLFINNYLPLFGLFVAFKDINYSQGLLQGIINGPWVGLKHFEFLFSSNDVWTITRNTLFYNGLFILLNNLCAIGIAILLKEAGRRLFSRFFQSVMLLPNFISIVVVSFLVYGLLSHESGFLNKTLLPLLGADPVMWYMAPEKWPLILVLVNFWKNVGMLTIVYFSAMLGIDPTYYEAAELDGAGKLRQIQAITLPSIVPVIIMMVLLSVGRIFYSDFGLFYQVPMNSGLLYDATSTIDTYVYRTLLQVGDVSMASAAGFFQSVVGFLLVLASNAIVRRVSRSNALF
jgi:putative aldouronate transport system permease protein